MICTDCIRRVSENKKGSEQHYERAFKGRHPCQSALDCCGNGTASKEDLYCFYCSKKLRVCQMCGKTLDPQPTVQGDDHAISS